MNILGEGFPKEIINQVQQRQKVYGSGYAKGSTRSIDDITYLNANTSWVKLSSSVNINNQNIINNDSLRAIPNIKDNNLAKTFVLFNGTEGENVKNRGGINFSNEILGGNEVYGIGGNEFGIKPMMGIKSANIKFENRGSLRRASVQIKAFNKIQFDIIDILYLRLGFSILLEWGHSMYFDNTGVLQKSQDNSLSDDFIYGTGKTVDGKTKILTYEDFLKNIDNKRITSNGNYDAMFAKVSNFHWSFIPDGSYDITLDLVSIGDVVESFKINVLNSGIQILDKTNPDLAKATSKEVITLFANRNSIGKYFYELSNNLIGKPKVELDKNQPSDQDLVEAGFSKEMTKSIGANIRLNDLRSHLELAKALKKEDLVQSLESQIFQLLKEENG